MGDLRYVDPEIRNVIRALQKLPFVRTRFCCAGYGPTAKFYLDRGVLIPVKDIQPTIKEIHPKIRGLYQGYVSLAYTSTSKRRYAFSLGMLKVADYITWLDDKEVIYDIFAGDVEWMRKKWGEVLKLAKGGGDGKDT